MSLVRGLYLSLRDLEEMKTERGMRVGPFHDLNQAANTTPSARRTHLLEGRGRPQGERRPRRTWSRGRNDDQDAIPT